MGVAFQHKKQWYIQYDHFLIVLRESIIPRLELTKLKIKENPQE
jgi:hypothetical protein